jgi:hypothetical protein
MHGLLSLLPISVIDNHREERCNAHAVLNANEAFQTTLTQHLSTLPLPPPPVSIASHFRNHKEISEAMGHTHHAEKHEATALELTACRTPPSEKERLAPVASRAPHVHEKVSLHANAGAIYT